MRHDTPDAELGFIESSENRPKTLALSPLPSSMPIPSCIAALTGLIGAESKTCGHGCGRGEGRKVSASRSRSKCQG
jgi:hypothetical protein